MKLFAVVALMFVFPACRAAPKEVMDPGLPAPADSTAAGVEADPPSARPAERPSCGPSLVLSPSTLATQWPALLGRRVRLRVRLLRALSFDEWLVTAGEQRFVVLAAPHTRWVGEHVFVVTGSTIAPVHGRTALPELLLDDDCTS